MKLDGTLRQVLARLTARQKVWMAVALVATLGLGWAFAAQWGDGAGVERLTPDTAEVVDGETESIAEESTEGPSTLSDVQLESRRRVEREIESTLISMLEPIVGSGRVRARATVELNMTSIERVEETYDPNIAVVRSEQKSRAPRPATDRQLENSTTSFELNKTISTISEPMGRLIRQSVAVVIDHALVETTDPFGEADRVSRPRTPAELLKITDLVRAGIGFDASRGDQLIVENIPFDDAVSIETTASDTLGLLVQLARYGSLPLAVLLLALLVIRPALAALRSVHAARDAAQDATTATVAGLQAALAAARTPGPGACDTPLHARLIDAVRDDPQAAALVVRDWIDRREDRTT